MDTHAAAHEHLFTLQEALGNTEKAVGTHVNLSVTVGNPVVEAQALDPAPEVARQMVRIFVPPPSIPAKSRHVDREPAGTFAA